MFHYSGNNDGFSGGYLAFHSFDTCSCFQFFKFLLSSNGARKLCLSFEEQILNTFLSSKCKIVAVKTLARPGSTVTGKNNVSISSLVKSSISKSIIRPLSLIPLLKKGTETVWIYRKIEHIFTIIGASFRSCKLLCIFQKILSMGK